MKKEDAARWEILAQKHEFLFGKKPSKKMKLETLEKKVTEEADKRSAEAKDSFDSQITAKMEELVELAKSSGAKEDEKPVMICMLATDRGVHMSMAGEGRDVAIMVATAMDNQPMIDAVITNAAMMCQMRKQDVAQQIQEEKPKTEA